MEQRLMVALTWFTVAFWSEIEGGFVLPMMVVDHP